MHLKNICQTNIFQKKKAMFYNNYEATLRKLQNIFVKKLSIKKKFCQCFHTEVEFTSKYICQKNIKKNVYQKNSYKKNCQCFHTELEFTSKYICQKNICNKNIYQQKFVNVSIPKLNSLQNKFAKKIFVNKNICKKNICQKIFIKKMSMFPYRRGILCKIYLSKKNICQKKLSKKNCQCFHAQIDRYFFDKFVFLQIFF